MKRRDGPFEIYEIIPGQLYQRGKLHGLSVEKRFDGLTHYGITHAVALAPTRPDGAIGAWVDYLHHPIPDSRLREGDYLLTLASTLADLIDMGGCVLTMCNAGRNRSGLLSALIVRELSGIPGAAAMDVVREHRPNALANPYFEAFLRGLP